MKIAILCAALVVSATSASAEFSLAFTWGDIPLCTNGKSRKVASPQFVVRDVPPGTDTLELRLKDLDRPKFNHGGGKLRISGSGMIPFGTFRYNSPCPPDGAHTYEWTATARSGNRVLATTKARRTYPE
ncbi:YbhB/YbcL family Raf kinase inhibitor-like protein [Puniceibacterium confluentis]|uniref:YbhB/YbcL family Raf kinase inhibitor-like protein n=1 Tax=Puniceibacterium confluentis TaxID=1958944 RepID=UPI0011B673FE|nr:YbhB/YbcL family Raf kinase inhibitor-like protein [Puniceibacterium confluentis]